MCFQVCVRVRSETVRSGSRTGKCVRVFGARSVFGMYFGCVRERAFVIYIYIYMYVLGTVIHEDRESRNLTMASAVWGQV